MQVSLKKLLALGALLFSQVNGHSWVEQMQVIDKSGSNGTQYIGAFGYMRGYVPRNATGFSDNDNVHLLPPNSAGRQRINDQDLLCAPQQQKAGNQTDGYPQLQAAAGDFVAMKYLENGHVSLPGNQKGKPLAGGSVFIFATTNPKEGETLANVLNWTADGNIEQGKLLTAQNFDDERCHQINPASTISADRQKQFPNPIPGQPGSQAELWCETDVQVPQDAAKGSMTFYWVWDWATMPHNDSSIPNGKDEYYTSCMDMKIIDPNNQANVMQAAVKAPLSVQDPNEKAVSGFQDRTAFQAKPRPVGDNSNSGSSSGSGGMIGGSGAASATSSSAAAPAAISSATSSTMSTVATSAASTPTSAAAAAATPPAASSPPAAGAAGASAGGTGVETVLVTETATVTAARRSEETGAHVKRHLHQMHGAKFRLG